MITVNQTQPKDLLNTSRRDGTENRNCIKVIRRTVPRNNCSKCLFYMFIYIFIHIYVYILWNKQLEQLLRGTILLITLIKYAQQDAEPQNKNKELWPVQNIIILTLEASHSLHYSYITKFTLWQKWGQEWTRRVSNRTPGSQPPVDHSYKPTDVNTVNGIRDL
jgi:hypothetical protein